MPQPAHEAMHPYPQPDATRLGAQRESTAQSRVARTIFGLAQLMCIAGAAQAQNCTFNGSAAGISFAPFDPSIATPQSAFTDLKVKCTPSGFTPTWVFTGANGSAPYQMKHTVQNSYIPYSLSVAFINNTGVNQNWRLTANVLGQDYVDAFAGSYSDILTATVLP